MDQVKPLSGRPLCATPDMLPIVDRAFHRPGSKLAHAFREQVCPTCPVHDQCLGEALERGEFGVWGGTSPTVRTKLGGRRPAIYTDRRSA